MNSAIAQKSFKTVCSISTFPTHDGENMLFELEQHAPKELRIFCREDDHRLRLKRKNGTVYEGTLAYSSF